MPTHATPSGGLLIAAEAYLARCFELQSPPHVSELAASLGVTVKQLSDAFFSETGERPATYLKRRQIDRAKD